MCALNDEWLSTGPHLPTHNMVSFVCGCGTSFSGLVSFARQAFGLASTSRCPQLSFSPTIPVDTRVWNTHAQGNEKTVNLFVFLLVCYLPTVESGQTERDAIACRSCLLVVNILAQTRGKINATRMNRTHSYL
jgi:hypothetical protein